MFKLSAFEIDRLVSQPESGMGYQVVDVVTRTGQIKRGLAVNAELLFLDESRNLDRILKAGGSTEHLLRSATPSGGEFKSISVVVDPRTTTLARRAVMERGAGAADADPKQTKPADRFYRFSAFEKDHRIRADKSLSPGSYATTEEDGRKVRSGADAVERYALPNNDPASFRFGVVPHVGTPIQRGIVVPANGHQGGGIEVIFSMGTQPATVMLPPTRLPDK